MDPIPLLKDLIALPSVNPMGRDCAGDEFHEGRVTAYLVRLFKELGVEHETIEAAPGRANVVARVEGAGSGVTVLLDAHQDTVPTDGMTIPPFDPVERDGRISGRGACDVKGGLSAMLAAFARLARERPRRMANVVLSCTCDEEATSLGIHDLTRLWTDPLRGGSLLARRPDVAVIAEPTDLDIVVAHRGAVRWKIRTAGRACHSSRPMDGINAIYRMARVLRVLEEYADELPRAVPAHPLCGPATLSVGRIEGGLSVNTVPDACAIDVDRRVVPGEDGTTARQQLIDLLRERLDIPVEHGEPWINSPPLADTHNAAWAELLMGHVAAVAGPRRKVGVAYGTHASRTAAAGVPSVVFGPGSIAQAHTSDEWISVAEVQAATEIYYQFCANVGQPE